MTYVEYLAAEDLADVRHEFLNGDVWAMSGGTPEHGALAVAISGDLRVALKGKPCRVYSSDVRVRVLATGLSTYPDVTVVCGAAETAPEDPSALINPVLLVEVLSDSTEGYDRGAKAAHYRRIPSLQAYLLVSQSEPVIELHRRRDDRWELSEARPGDDLDLPELGIRLDVRAIYANPFEA
jgi:Uma2 family endonuclease